VNAGVAGIELDRLLVLVQRAVDIAALGQRPRQQAMRQFIGRVDLQHRLILLDSAMRVAGLLQQHTQIVAGFQVPGVLGDRHPELPNRAVGIALTEQQHTLIVMRRRCTGFTARRNHGLRGTWSGRDDLAHSWRPFRRAKARPDRILARGPFGARQHRDYLLGISRRAGASGSHQGEQGDGRH